MSDREPATEEYLLRRYLLGELSAPERMALEERLLSDDELFQELVLMEDDLVDEYVFGELPPESQERLERHFAAAPERRQAIRVAELLRDRAGGTNVGHALEPGPATTPPAASPARAATTLVRPPPRLPSRHWAAMAATVSLLLAGALVVHRQRIAGLERALEEIQSAEQARHQQTIEREQALRDENARLAARLGQPPPPRPGQTTSRSPAPPP